METPPAHAQPECTASERTLGFGLLSGSLAILLITFAALWPVLRAPFVWDDDLYLTMNRTLARPGGLLDIWINPYSSPSPYPLVFTTYWFEYRVWGLNPVGYRFVNLLLHALTSILLWRALLRLEVKGAWLAGAIFALHPVHVESVVHAAERKDVLSGVFYFVSIIYWANFMRAGGWRFYAVSLVAFVAAMLSKTVTCTLPPTLLLLIWWKLERPSRVRPALLTLPFFAIALALGLYTILWEKHRTGATSDVIDLDFLDRAMIAARAVWFYFWKLAWPSNLVTLYPKWTMSVGHASDWLFAVGLAGLALVTLQATLRRGRHMAVPLVFVILTLGPALGFINFSTMYFSYVMDHYQYLACAGWIALFALVWRDVALRISGQQMYVAASAGLLGVLGFLSWQQSEVYGSLLRHWEHNVQGNPESAPPRYDYGVALENVGRLDEATAQFTEAIKYNPNDVDSYLHLGGIMKNQGKLDAALGWFEWAARVKPDHPKARRSQASAHNHIGVICIQQGRHAEALESFEKAIAINPNLMDARTNLGLALTRMDKFEEAESHYREVIREFPAADTPPVFLYRLLKGRGRIEEAESVLRDAIAADPDNIPARVTLAERALGNGEIELARSLADECLAIDPANAQANILMGAVEATQGNYEAAMACFQTALKSEPNNATARKNLELARSDLERVLKGIK